MKKLKSFIIVISLIFGTFLSAELTLSWENFYGGENDDFIERMLLLDDDNYLAVGHSESYGFGEWGKPDVWLAKLDVDGNILWDRTYGEADSSDKGYSIIEVNDGYMIAGERSEDEVFLDGCGGLIIKVDFDGNEIWSKKYGGEQTDVFRSIHHSNDGNLILSGVTKSYGAEFLDSWVVKIDPDGEVIWEQVFGGSGYDILNQVYPTDDGGYIGIGFTNSTGAGSYDVWVVKMDSLGEIEWEKTNGDVQSNRSNHFIKNSAGNYILTGLSRNDEGEKYMLVMELDPTNGEQIWQNTYQLNNESEGYFIEELPYNQGYLIAGENYNNMSGLYISEGWVVKIDNQGNILDNFFLHAAANSVCTTIKLNSSSKYIVTGSSRAGSYDVFDLWIRELNDDELYIEDSEKLIVNSEKLKQNYPNPFNPMTRINYELRITNYEKVEIVVHNAMGQSVWSTPVGAKNLLPGISATNSHGSIQFDGSKFNSGIYYYSLIINGQKMDTKSMILIK